MSNFKSGSGNLDFGGDDEDEEESEATAEVSQTQTETSEDAESVSSDASRSAPSDRSPSTTESTASQQESARMATEEATASDATTERYPYFVRRSNVGDERDTRLEIHVRDKVADRESKYRNELADQLDVNEVSKTDVREFAMIAAFHNPEGVAELMRDEGLGTLR